MSKAYEIVRNIENNAFSFRASRSKAALAAKNKAKLARSIYERIQKQSKKSETVSAFMYQLAQKKAKAEKAAKYLAAQVGMNLDEHGWDRGDYFTTKYIDFVPAEAAKAAPFCDMGGRGLALIEVTRVRRYAKSSTFRSSTAVDQFLIGRNETGTFFAHAVPVSVGSVRLACQWIWSDNGHRIIQRQGDIALIEGAGPKVPSLPDGHRIEGGFIVHDQHPALPLPAKGQRVIVGRRAKTHASVDTRD
jgi:hypothetical protein